ncbi:MAG: class I SAM-dependent methyltransferase [Methanomassiliicoccales archaeon]|nr:MAG: class I SAM-dependent methyltransferase [Methanomassiliicoccales archaeon]
MRILDIGCGRGDFTVGVLGKRDAMVVGIDSSPEFLKEAKRIAPPNCEFVLTSASNMCFKGGSFDEIHCNHVLEHVPNLDNALDGIANALAPKGRLFLSIPYPFLEKILANLMEGYIGEKMHRRIIQPKELVEELRKRGIVVTKVEKRKFYTALLLTYRFIRGMPYEPQSGLLAQEDAISRFLEKVSRWSLQDPNEADFGKKRYIKAVLILANIKERVMRHIYPHENYMEAVKA